MYKIIIAIHIISATIWTGGHLILALGFLPRALKNRDPNIITNFEATFEKLGIPALLVQVITGMSMGFMLINSWQDWFKWSDSVARNLLIKLILLGLTVVLAMHARLKIIPNLNKDNLNLLATHIILVTVVSVLFVITGVGFRFGGLF